VERGVPPVFFANAAKTLMKGASRSQKTEPVQLNPNKSTYTWKGDHYEQIQPYGL
jgi:hypothetical protein